jgi:hypothetical protein
VAGADAGAQDANTILAIRITAKPTKNLFLCIAPPSLTNLDLS